MKKPITIFNNAKSAKAAQSKRPWFSIKNEASNEAAEILIYDEIGIYGWDGVTAESFVEQLKAIPRDREIVVGINSPGGSVANGLAIYNLLRARRDKVTTRIDGVAASIASVIALAGKEVKMPKAALFMIHNPWTYASGDAAEFRRFADALDVHAEAIAAAYHAKTGKPLDEIHAKMDEETWFTGQEARNFGFVDVLTDEPVDASALSKLNFSGFRHVPEALNQTRNPQPSAADRGGQITMNRAQIIALLVAAAVTFDEKATDAELIALLETTVKSKKPEPKKDPETPAPAAAAPASTPAPAAPAPAAAAPGDVNARIATIEAAYQAERNTRLEREVDAAISERRILAAQRDSWLKRVQADETILADIKAMPVMALPADDPIQFECTGESVKDIEAAINRASTEVSVSFLRGNNVAPKAFKESAVIAASIYEKNRSKLLPVLNANTVSADLKRQAFLQEFLRAFASRLMPLRAFATVHENVPLEGEDTVVVPFYDLHAVASKDFVAATGYEFDNSATDSRKIPINKRKYQGLSLTSAELRRQPFLNMAQNAVLAGERLADDVFADILGVVTLANYGAAVYAGPASAFDSDEVVDIRTDCNTSKWPKAGRSLIVDSAFDGALLKDPAVKHAFNYGSNGPIQEGEIPKISGFNYFETPSIPDNGQTLAGMAVFMSAILVATAPVLPVEEVRRLLSRYQVIVDARSGIAIEARSFGSAQMDTGYYTLESNYGFDVGQAEALKRIQSAA